MMKKSKDQSLVWDYLCFDNILRSTHCLEDMLSFKVNNSFTSTCALTHIYKKEPSLMLHPPIQIMLLAKFIPSSMVTVSKCD